MPRFTDYRTFRTAVGGRLLELEIGKVCEQANGQVWVKYGDTVVNVTVCASKEPKEGMDFFPLSVDFEEKLYSVGKIPGTFQRREGRASEKAVLAARVIDRPIRPLFPKDMRNDVSIVATAMSVDPDCSPEITAMVGASIALSISDNTMTISASSQEFGEAHETIDVELTGEPINIAFNPQYLGDPLKTLACDKFELKFNDGVTPVEMTGDPGFIYILMPMRGN